MEEIEIGEDFVTIRNRGLILKLRSLGAGVEEADETRVALLEAAYFADRGVLPVEKEKLLKRALGKDKLAREKFTVIKQLRDAGYIVRPSLDGTRYLRLHRKGMRPGEDKTYYLIDVVGKGWKAGVASLQESMEAAGRLRKELAVAVVDGDKCTFIKFARMNFG